MEASPSSGREYPWAGFAVLATAVLVAVWCAYRIGGALGLARVPRLALTASFGLCTVALPYAAHVNNHALLLGVTAALMLGLVRLADARAAGRVPWGLLAALGTL